MSWHHIADRTPKAYKPHRCYLCELPIVPDTVHILRVGTCDGALFDYRMHSDCEALTHGWTCHNWDNHDASEFREFKEQHAKVLHGAS